MCPHTTYWHAIMTQTIVEAVDSIGFDGVYVDQVGNGGISGLMRIINQSSLDLEPLRAHYSSELVALLASLLAKPALMRGSPPAST